MWNDNPDGVRDRDVGSFSQFAQLFFIDVDAGPESLRNRHVDAVLPYDHVTLVRNTSFAVTENYMVSEVLVCVINTCFPRAV